MTFSGVSFNAKVDNLPYVYFQFVWSNDL